VVSKTFRRFVEAVGGHACGSRGGIESPSLTRATMPHAGMGWAAVQPGSQQSKASTGLREVDWKQAPPVLRAQHKSSKLVRTDVENPYWPPTVPGTPELQSSCAPLLD
jgi:hypothetical protein